MTHADATPITEDWLRSTGFKWSQEERQPHKHWTLWIGQAIPEPGYRHNSADDLGLELTQGIADRPYWFCWFRSDLAGRYSRFIHVRHLETVEQLTRLIEALTDRPWDPANVLYGQYWTPEAAERLKRDAERLDWRIAQRQAKARGEDDSAAR